MRAQAFAHFGCQSQVSMRGAAHSVVIPLRRRSSTGERITWIHAMFEPPPPPLVPVERAIWDRALNHRGYLSHVDDDDDSDDGLSS